MAKILVADDNSNIQKMVVLALKDQGIEVVAVGNGEAAVRKISDVKPDLVLADIFMPVRNGYEVCKFVKDASALSHIPVILLVGAFDPLDEQEAQRVGADGVLKKPFVPPDPLISMVKSALTRAGVVLGASVPPPPIPVAAKLEPPLPRVVPPPAPFAAEAEEEPGLPAFAPPAPPPLTIDKGSQPLAFGSLLDSQLAPEDEAVFSISSGARVAPERDWGPSPAAEEQEEAEDSSKHGNWRAGSLEETVDEVPAGQTDWREAAFSGIGTEKNHSAGWAPSVEKNSLSITEEEAAALARERDSLPATRGPEDWSKAIGEVFAEKPAVEKKYQAPATNGSPTVPPPPIPEAVSAISPEVSKPEVSKPEVGPAANTWMAGAVSPWDSEMSHSSQLASSWEAVKTASPAMVQESATEAFLDSGLMSSAPPAQAEEPAREEPPEAPATSATDTVSTIESLLSPVTQEILHEEAAQAVAAEQPAPAPSHSVEAGTVAPAQAAPPAEPNMEEIVARVLARMNPGVLQAVTREILKPLVEEMIKDELHKK